MGFNVNATVVLFRAQSTLQFAARFGCMLMLSRITVARQNVHSRSRWDFCEPPTSVAPRCPHSHGHDRDLQRQYPAWLAPVRPLSPSSSNPPVTGTKPVDCLNTLRSSLAVIDRSDTIAGIHLANNGFMTSSDAQIIATLSSIAGQTTTYVPDSVRISTCYNWGKHKGAY